MAVDQLPEEAREFAHRLGGLLARVDQGAGWAGVFWRRDPDGMRECVEGREVPPWDVVEALLQDVAAAYGARAAEQEAERLRPLHAAALVAHDDRPGGRDALEDRLDVMLREQRYAAERQAELGRLLAAATTPEETEALRLDLAWTHDDHARATARCAELRRRLAARDDRARERTDPRHRTGPGRPRATPAASGPRDPAYGAGTGEPAVAADAADAADFTGFFARGDVTGPAGPLDRGGPADAADFDGPAHPGDFTGPTGPTDRSGPAGPVADLTAGGDLTDWTDRADRTDRVAAHEYGVTAADRPTGGGPALTGPGWTSTDGHPDPSRRDPAHAPDQHADGPYGNPADPHADGPYATPAGPHAEPHPDPAQPPAPTVPKQRKRRRGSARFAGMAEDAAVAVPAQADGNPALPGLGPAPAPTGRRGLRGARFAGAAAEREAPSAPRPRETGPVDDRARQEAAGAVERLVALRARGLSGEAHALLVELAYWPAARVPLLAAELQHAGLGADWATLLWETASLPVERLVAAADALLAAGRADDAERILRQGVGRPAEEMGEAVRDLAAQGRHREVRALLDAYVRVRAPEEAARSAAPEPRTLAPLLLEAARGVSDARYRDLVHALRVAGLGT
ncbi:hypothetical protein [Streptomyces longwoodensis]|uniref:hypothetical protein n=1 Tax=Streptomyces longwoodensis TaxID=68231 RepID=UPI0033CF80D1